MTAPRLLPVLIALAAGLPAAAWADPMAATATTPASSNPTGATATAQVAPGKSGAGDARAGARGGPHGVAAVPTISCPGDAVVWVNPRSKAYHLAGDPFFGRTRHGRFVCRKAADAAGDHPIPAAK